MENVDDFTIEKAKESKYISIRRIFFKQNGKPRIWDSMFQHDSVSILIHHIERDSFLFVKQFRPAVYIQKALKQDGQDENKPIDTKISPPKNGCTFELCAGIVDKNTSLVQIAKEEVLEEVGYDVPIDRFELIRKSRHVGISGSLQTMYYVTVNEAMKVSSGGGNLEEGEIIEVIEVPVKDSYNFAMSEEIESPVGMAFAILWFFHNKRPNKNVTG